MDKFRFQMLYEITSNKLITTEWHPLATIKINRINGIEKPNIENSDIKSKLEEKCVFQQTQDLQPPTLFKLNSHLLNAETQTQEEIKENVDF